MKNSVCMLFVFFIAVTAAKAQKLITLQSLNGVTQYISPDSAIAHAVDGDQVYFPGGIYSVGNLVINKSLMIFGPGHYNDSALATGKAYIIGNITLSSGSSAGIFTGFDVDGDIKVDVADSVSNYTISRCSFRNLYLSQSGLPPTNARNFSVYENIIRGNVYCANATGINCSKNFIEGGIGYVQSGIFNNNDFLGTGNCATLLHMLTAVKTSNFDNNIFLFTPPACAGASFFDTASVNNVLMNNLFVMNITFPVAGNSGFNSIVNQPVNSIFTSASGNMFQYGDNYHLKAGSPGLYAGTDNYDVGVYGTANPFKVASVPFNPHIQMKSIGHNTNPQGLLNVHIKVASQER